METVHLNTEINQQQFSVEPMLNDNLQTPKEKAYNRHNSALFAASIARSAVGHAGTNRISRKPGDFAHSGTHIVYED